MQFVTVRDFRGHSKRVWKSLKADKELIITSNGKPLALLSDLGDRDIEEELEVLRRSRAILALKSVQRESAKRGLDKISLDEINKEIEAVRKDTKDRNK